jgi:hypothetical protein
MLVYLLTRSTPGLAAGPHDTLGVYPTAQAAANAAVPESQPDDWQIRRDQPNRGRAVTTWVNGPYLVEEYAVAVEGSVTLTAVWAAEPTHQPDPRLGPVATAGVLTGLAAEIPRVAAWLDGFDLNNIAVHIGSAAAVPVVDSLLGGQLTIQMWPPHLTDMAAASTAGAASTHGAIPMYTLGSE